MLVIQIVVLLVNAMLFMNGSILGCVAMDMELVHQDQNLLNKLGMDTIVKEIRLGVNGIQHTVDVKEFIALEKRDPFILEIYIIMEF
jgi:hypothetical protein